MRRILITLAALAAVTSIADAQEPSFQPEIRPFIGAFVPTGSQRDDFRDATTLGLQGAIEFSKYFHVVATMGWTHGHAKFALADDLTYIWNYDAGAEFNALMNVGQDWLWRPFVGLGAGGRTYDYRADNVDGRTCTAAYAAVGTELQRRWLALRAEGRDYVNCFTSPLTGKKSTRNDVMLTLGVALHVW